MRVEISVQHRDITWDQLLVTVRPPDIMNDTLHRIDVEFKVRRTVSEFRLIRVQFEGHPFKHRDPERYIDELRQSRRVTGGSTSPSKSGERELPHSVSLDDWEGWLPRLFPNIDFHNAKFYSDELFKKMAEPARLGQGADRG